jgi:hypothetical protein
MEEPYREFGFFIPRDILRFTLTTYAQSRQLNCETADVKLKSHLRDKYRRKHLVSLSVVEHSPSGGPWRSTGWPEAGS